MAGCAASGVLHERIGILQEHIKFVREKQRGEECAPRPLAIAEANVQFAVAEVDEGYGGRAREHLDVAEVAAAKALEESRHCAETALLAPKVKVVPIAKDTDGDGISDVEDDCPLVPGIRQPHPKNGCAPPKDSDGDGVPDEIDRCPNVAGPASNQGCPIDRDGDGIPDDQDLCPDEPGIPELKGCPIKDTDGDGVPDHLDKCPTVPGPAENNGCPWPDRDKDGVPDKDDRCPDVPGQKQFAGCPDTDGDGIPDIDDKCPNEPGPPEFHGCPPPAPEVKKHSLVVVTKKRIEILQQVHFATNRWQILPDSFELLDQVAQVLTEMPALHVEVQGHTDNAGSKAFNTTLSQQRAESVRRYLIDHSVDGKRLLAKGFGPNVPLASNTSERGRAQNRRVEFHILER